MAALQKQIETLQGQAAEHQRAAQFWYDRANGGGEKPQPAAKPDTEPDPDVLELLTTKGVKGLDELLAKRGFVRADQVDAKVDSRAAKLVAEQQLVKRYPDLNRRDSEFFQATAIEYGALKKQGVPEHMAMEMAAERTELAFMRTGKIKTATQQAADEERQARAAASGGDPSRRMGSSVDESDDTLNDDDKRAIAQIADGLDISMEDAEKRYRARAKAGVRVSNRSFRG